MIDAGQLLLPPTYYFDAVYVDNTTFIARDAV